jgi:hypothetical protein
MRNILNSLKYYEKKKLAFYFWLFFSSLFRINTRFICLHPQVDPGRAFGSSKTSNIVAIGGVFGDWQPGIQPVPKLRCHAL